MSQITLMGLGFRKAVSNLIRSHTVATNVEVKDFDAGIQGDAAVFPAHQKASGVERHFEFKRRSDKAGTERCDVFT